MRAGVGEGRDTCAPREWGTNSQRPGERGVSFTPSKRKTKRKNEAQEDGNRGRQT